MPVRTMLHLRLGVFLALLSLIGTADAQVIAGHLAFNVDGDAALVNNFEKELKKKSSLVNDCSHKLFEEFADPVTQKKQRGLLVTCKSKKSYPEVSEIFRVVTKGEDKKHLSMAHTIVQNCPGKICAPDKTGPCIVYPCPSRPATADVKEILPGYYFGCYHQGFPCDESHKCTAEN